MIPAISPSIPDSLPSSPSFLPNPTLEKVAQIGAILGAGLLMVSLVAAIFTSWALIAAATTALTMAVSTLALAYFAKVRAEKQIEEALNKSQAEVDYHRARAEEAERAYNQLIEKEQRRTESYRKKCEEATSEVEAIAHRIEAEYKEESKHTRTPISRFRSAVHAVQTLRTLGAQANAKTDPLIEDTEWFKSIG